MLVGSASSPAVAAADGASVGASATVAGALVAADGAGVGAATAVAGAGAAGEVAGVFAAGALQAASVKSIADTPKKRVNRIVFSVTDRIP